jgi:hypothetical protein
MPLRCSRRAALQTFAAGVPILSSSLLSKWTSAQEPAGFRLATFSADVTPPLGHPLLAGWRAPAKSIADRLQALGCVLLGAGQPLVIVSVDWCELRNDAYDLWRDKLAAAAGTVRERVLVSCVHQHDAPYADLQAQQLLDKVGLKNAMIDPEFHAATVQTVADAAKKSLDAARPITHLGLGQAEVDRVASNRRVVLAGAAPKFNRYSFTRDAAILAADAGEIDPVLKTLSFWNNDQPVAALSAYAVHPMSYYGSGEVSADFVGLARMRRQRDLPAAPQIYLTGACGDVTAGKYNEGTPDGRKALAERVYQAMTTAWEKTRRVPLTQVRFRSTPLAFEPEIQGALAPQALHKLLTNAEAPARERIEAALGLSWQARCALKQPIDVPAIDFGPAQLALAPAEAFVATQLAAQQSRPDSFVMVAAFGESAPGYIPTEKARTEGFVEEHKYCWVAAGSEPKLRQALEQAIK